MSTTQKITSSAINLLKKMITIPSLSREEKEVADLIEQYLKENAITTGRLINNIYALNKYFDPAKKSILLNSHHDTVKPAKGYTTDPFTPIELEGRLIGLGSNDAGGPLVSLIATFIHFFNRQDLPFNIVLAATAEEEISGTNGIELLLKDEAFLNMLQGSTFMGALVGEPTKMEMAVAERGLLVLDGTVHGKAGHAAREEGINSIYLAMQDIQAIAKMDFDKTSELLGKTTAKVTVIETENKAHNVVPAS
jgi:acetylornithine deacetylase